MRQIHRASFALVCFFALTGSAQADVWTQAEMERCFAYEDEELTAKVILRFQCDLVAGVAFGNVSAATGET